MIEFTLAEDQLPFNYFDELDFSFENIAIECIRKKHSELSEAECETVFDNNYDLFSEKMYELRQSEAINDYCIGEKEVDESTGTWGYLLYEINDIDKARKILADAVRDLVEEVIDDIEL